VAEHEPRRCEAPDCDVEFVPQRSTARYHSATCRQRAQRSRKAAEHQQAEEAKTDTDAEHGLVAAVRKELSAADALDTVLGQMALQLARRAANPQEPGLVNLTKEIRAVMTDAIGARKPGGGDGADGDRGEPEDDEVTRARRQREEARQAAGLS
jgi:hypothetical protein